MSIEIQTQTFKNKLLIAMPTLNDPYFQKAVLLIFDYTKKKGATGLIINRPLDISLGEILQHLNIPLTHSELDQDKVMLGGPVASEQGFIIHTHPELCPGDIVDEENKITVSASKEVLQSIVEKQPDNILVCLGYSSWTEGQLEQEIADNAWMLSEVDPQILFQIPYQERWEASAKLLGVDIDKLSSDVGHG